MENNSNEVIKSESSINGPNATPAQNPSVVKTSKDIFLNIIKNPQRNLSDFQVLTSNKFFDYTLDKSENILIQKLIILPSLKAEKVEEKSELKCHIQKYLVNAKTGDLIIINKDFKNIVKKEISKMKREEKILRKLLLGMTSDQIIAYKVDINYEKENFLQLSQKPPKEVNLSDCENFFIYLIALDYVYKELKEEKIEDYNKYTKKLYDQVKYLIEKEEYTQAISIINKTFKNYTENKSLVAELNSKKNAHVKVECDKIFEKLISNKIFCLEKKNNINSKKKDYEDALKALDNEYFKYYKYAKNADKTIFLKCLGRKCRYYIQLKMHGKSKDIFEQIKQLFPQEKACIGELERELLKYEAELNKQKEILNRKKKPLAAFLSVTEEADYFDQWDVASQVYDVSSNVDIGLLEYKFE